MHSVALGVVKMLVTLTFKLQAGQQRSSASDLTRVPLRGVNELLLQTRVPKEFSRKVRELDTAVWKAEEYRNLILFLWPAIIENLPLERNRDKKLWLLLVFCIRSYVLPAREFRLVNSSLLEKAQTTIVDLIGRIHGHGNATYNVHQLTHLALIRQKGPLCKTSAFPFEDMFSFIRNGFFPGSPNPVLQIFQHIFHRRRVGHTCRRKIAISARGTRRVDDSLFYTFKENEYAFYQLQDDEEDIDFFVGGGNVKARQILAYEEEDPLVPLNSVGVFISDAIDQDTTDVPVSDIAGKAILVGNYIMSVPNGTLREI